MKIYISILSTFIFLCFLATQLNAQTGPGGVGSNDGTSTLELWLKADAGLINESDNPATDGDRIKTWQDQSGNGLNATQGTSGDRPLLIADGVNSRPKIFFDKTRSDHFDFSRITFNDDATIYTIVRSKELKEQGGFFMGDNTTDEKFGIWDKDLTGELTYGIRSLRNIGGWLPWDDEQPWPGLTDFVMFYLDRDPSDLFQLSSNGEEKVDLYGGNIYAGEAMHLGKIGGSKAGDQYWDGDITEVIMFQEQITETQRLLINNYLSSKYGISIPDTADLYAFDANHSYDVAGIGQYSGSAHNEAKSDSLITLKSPSALGNNDFILFGHDNASRASWVTTELPNNDTLFERINREWRFDTTGTPGTVTISLDPTILPATNADFNFYVLWIDEDGDFTSGATPYSLVQNGAEYEVSNVLIPDGAFLTISAYKPTLNFTQVSSSGLESETPAHFTIEISHAVYSDITFDYAISGTADGHNLVSSNATISATNTSVVLSATITDDGDDEDEETIIIDITNVSTANAVIGSSAKHTYTINDNDNATGRSISFHNPCDYNYKKTITIDADKISGTTYHENFPVLISITDADLQAQVQSADGYDIGFTLKNSFNWLDHQIHSYNNTTGELLAWVRFDQLSCAEDTEIEMYYGNANISIDPSTNNVWDADLYYTVFNLEEDPTTVGTYTDKTGKGHAGEPFNFAGGDLVSGKVGNCLDFVRANNPYIAVNDQYSGNDNTEVTVSAWIQTLDGTRQTIYSYDRNEYWRLGVNSRNQGAGLVDWDIRTDGGQADVYTTSTVNDGNWHHIVATYKNGVYNIYFDGNFEQANSQGTVFGLDNNRWGIIGQRCEGTGYDQPDGFGFNGLIDETRHLKKALSAQWIATEFANQGNPASFYNVGNQENAACELAESVDSVTFTIEINSIDAGQATTVNYAVISGNMQSGSDYVLENGTATIAAGDNRAIFTVDLINDLSDENDETITIELSNPSSNTDIGSNKTLTFTVIDDDDEPTVQFVNTTSYYNEGADLITIPVQLSQVSGKDVIVDYAISDGTATGSGTDFLLEDGTLTITAGESFGNISANIIDDASIEGQESFTIDITIGTPDAADLGANTTLTIVIDDNDNFGFEGPGGVGSLDGSGNLVMWVVADSLVTKDGNNAVSKWGNLVNISALDLHVIVDKPKWNDLAANGHAEISFGAADVSDRLQTNTKLSASYFPRNEATTFTVTRHDNSSQQSCSYSMIPSEEGNRFAAHMPWSDNVYFDIGDWSNGGRVNFAYNPLWLTNFQIYSYRARTAEGKEVWKDNALEKTATGTSTISNHTNYYFALGGKDVGTQKFQGDISEYILFKNPINNTQINIINNYLGAKYGTTISNDMFAFQSLHSHEVAGIGKESSTDFHVTAKASGITLSNASSLTDGDYLFFGHNNEDATEWVKGNVIPGDSIRRVNKEWRFDVTGTPGTVALAIDTNLFPTKPTAYSEYIVVIDDDGDFSHGATSYSTTLVNGEYVASNVTINNGSYMCICTAIRTVSFATVGTNSAEANSVNIDVSLNIPSGEDITVDYVIKSSTATGGNVDYTLSNGSITIIAGQTMASLAPGIINDAEIENEENFVVALRNVPSGLQIGADSIHTYRIQDDDNTRTMEFRSAQEFGFKRTITIDNTMVSGSIDLVDFPVLISITDVGLKHTSETDGNVTSILGYDIMFSLSDTVIWLSHEVESYDPVNGTLVAWVKIPDLSYNEDTELEIYYGNSNIITNPSTEDVWENYYAVWHLHSNVNDASSNNENGFNSGSTNAINAKIADGQSFDGTHYIELPDLSNLNTDFTITAWINPTDNSQSGPIFCDDANNNSGYYFELGSPGAGLLRFGSRNMTTPNLDGAQVLSNSSWHYVAGVADITNQDRLIYVNGALDNSNTSDAGTWGADYGNASIGGEVAYGDVNNRIDALLDEVRISKNVLSADWLATEYNNQNAPSTFYSLGNEDTLSQSGLESVDSLLLTVYVNEIDYLSATTVDFESSGGTANAGTDYSNYSGTVSIAAGEQSASFEIKITNDLIDEEDETLVIKLSNPNGANIGNNTTNTYTIEDDDDAPEIEFIDAISYVNEGTSTIIIPVELSNVSGTEVTVNYSATGGTATGSGSDYIITGSALIIEQGNLTGNITFSIIDDDEIEVPETITIDLSSPSGAELGTTTTHTVNINDNDDEGYDGPGGVGDADGSGSLVLWLRGDDGISVNGSSQVTAWDNMVGITGLNMEPADPGILPDWIDNEINGHAVISFNNVDDALETVDPLSATYFPYNEATTFTITTHDNLSQQSYMYTTAPTAGGGAGTNRFTSHIPWNGTAYFDIGQCCDADGRISFTYENAWIGNTSLFTFRAGSSYGKEVWKDNSSVKTVAGTDVFSNHPNYNFYLGKKSTHNFQGDIGEYIMFTNAINNAQVNIVNNYLAAKYNLSVDNDLYNFDVSHGVDVAGIGRADADNIHYAARAGFITINNASALGDGDYIMFGHNNADVSAWGTTDIPTGSDIKRLTREWRVDTTGTPGTITVSIDTTMLPNKTVGYYDYILMVDTDGSFSSGATVYNTVLVDGEYKASNVSIDIGEYFAVGIIRRTIAFNQISDESFETASNTIMITMDYASSENVEFDYIIKSSTATGGSVDYALADGTATIIAGQTTVNVDPGIINDTDVESDENFVLALRNSPSGYVIGKDSVFNYTIHDDDNPRKIEFQSTSDSGDEDAGTVTVTIEINSIDNTNPTTVDFAVTGGTAEANPSPDFTITEGTATIAATQSTTTFGFTILDDVLDEADTETIIITLSSPTNSNLGSDITYTYTINDNDNAPTIEFQTTSSNIDEGAEIAPVVVELSHPSGQDVTINYAINGSSTAIGSGTDYTLNNGTLTIGEGDVLGTINVALTDDNLEEGAETVILDISIPNGATLGTNQQHTVTITDNDAIVGYYGPGGVGNQEILELWLDASNVYGKGQTLPNDGDAISEWKDISGNEMHFTTLGSGIAAPEFDEDNFNAKPAISISSSQLGLRAPALFSNSLGNYSFFGAVEQSGGQYLIDQFNTGNSQRFSLNQGTNGIYYSGSWRLNGNSSTSEDIMSWIFNESANPESDVYRNGTSLDSDNNYSVMTLSNNFTIGSQYTGETNGDFTGNISELILYSKPLNSTQRIIVENYLAAKYGKATNYDRYSYDGSHGYYVAGIGQFADGDNHLTAMSDSTLMVSSASSLGTGDFVLIGHDNTDLTTWTVVEAPDNGKYVKRLAREWRTEITGTPGTVILKIDGDMLPSTPANFEQYLLYVDSDGDFRYDASTHQLEYSAIDDFYVSEPITLVNGDFIAIGCGKPVIEFTLTASAGFESGTNPNIEVSLNFTRGEDVSVDFFASGGTAIGGNVDYLLPAGTITVAAGQSAASLSLGIINDINVESSETVEITIFNPSDNIALGEKVIHTFTINDDDQPRDIYFQTTSSTEVEDAGTIAITLELDSQDNTNPTTVEYSVYETSTATEGDDFEALSGTATILATQTTTTFDVVLTDDMIDEGDEDIIIWLSNPTNANLGTDKAYTLTITDNDDSPTIEFSSTSGSGLESLSPVQLEVELTATSESNIKVDYEATVASTASNGSDFILSNGTLTIPAGQSNEDILLQIIDDNVVEGTETVVVTISNPVNAILGSAQSFTYTINDNDNAGYTGPGGVGDSESLLAWLRADKITDVGELLNWPDQSGNGADASTVATKRPDVETNGSVLNGKQYVKFNGNDDYVVVDNIASGADDFTIFYAYRSTVTDNDQVLFSSDDTDDFILMHNETSGGSFYDASNTWLGPQISGTNGQIAEFYLESGSNTAEVSINNGARTQSNYTETGIGGTRRIGSASDGSSNMFEGEIAEVVFFNSMLNGVQEKIVHNYLAAKYDITITDDLYDFEVPHSEDLAGIGYESASNLHLKAQSASMITISNPSTMGAGDYLLIAHDNAAINTWSATDCPDESERIARQWRVDVVGSPGSVSITLDSTLLTARPADYPGFVLLVDTDGDGVFSNSSDIYPMYNVSGSLFQSDNITFSEGDYLTIGVTRNITDMSSDGNFNDPTNWASNIVPGSGQVAIIDQNDDMFLTDDITIGSLIVKTGGSLDLNGYTLTFDDGCIELEGTASVDVSQAGNTVEYVKGGDQCITGMEYYNLTLETSGSKYLQGNVIINGDLDIADNGVTFETTTSDFNINLRGNWTNLGIFNEQESTVTFDGSAAQEINSSDAETFYNLTIDKTGGNVSLASDVNILNALTLNNGDIILGSNDLVIDSDIAISGGGDDSYIQAYSVGVVKRKINTVPSSKFFPVGDASIRTPFYFTLNSADINSAYVTMNLRASKHGSITLDNYIKRYWTLNETGISGTIDYNVSYTYDASDVIGTEADLEARKFSGSGNVIGGNVDTGTHTLSYDGHTSFSDHTGEGDSPPLPVELVKFIGKTNESNIDVLWTTASENNNDYFEVQFSTDAENFEPIGKVYGAGTSYMSLDYSFIHRNPIRGVNYYRLKQVDFNGDVEIHNTIAVDASDIGKLNSINVNVYPNPFIDGDLILDMAGIEANTPIVVSILTMSGSNIINAPLLVPHTQKVNLVPKMMSGLEKGIYIVKIKTNSAVLTKKFIVK